MRRRCDSLKFVANYIKSHLKSKDAVYLHQIMRKQFCNNPLFTTKRHVFAMKSMILGESRGRYFPMINASANQRARLAFD